MPWRLAACRIVSSSEASIAWPSRRKLTVLAGTASALSEDTPSSMPELPAIILVKPEKDGGKSGFYPYSVSPTDSMNYLRRPSPGSLLRPEIRALLAQGEYESAALGIYSTKPGELKAELSAIQDSKGNPLP